MAFRNLHPRYVVAIAIGIVSTVILSSLLKDSEVGAGFLQPDVPPVLVSTGTVVPNDNLAVILKRAGLAGEFTYPVQKSLSSVLDLRRQIQPGDDFELVTSTTGVFKRFVYRPDPIRAFIVTRDDLGAYVAEEQEEKTVWMEKVVACEVTTNVNSDLIRAGFDPSIVDPLVVELADYIFAWRIDFFTEQRKGDKLTVLAEFQYPLGGDKPIPGRVRVLAASYEGSGTRRRENVAIRYAAADESRPEYFDMKGEAVRKAFLRAPFTHGAFRISSYFNPRRMHPIKRVYRAHHGIDYAASRGTPVASIGNGRVSYAGWKGGYGNTVEVRHSGKYLSRYGHLSSIAVKSGQAVGQGTLLGRVGATGLATGPHLHFEMIVDGRPRNFLRMNFPSVKSVSAKDMDEFKKVRDQAMARLKGSPVVAALTVNSSLPTR